jgi:hypothetical protein
MGIPRGARASRSSRKVNRAGRPSVEWLEVRRLLAVAPPASASSGAIASGDFNGDGRLDLVELGRDDSLSVLMNEGPSAGTGVTTFAPPVTYHLDGSPSRVAIADFRGDGELDLAVSIYGGLGGVDILMGNGDGTFRPAVHVAVPGMNSRSVALRRRGMREVRHLIPSSSVFRATWR